MFLHIENSVCIRVSGYGYQFIILINEWLIDWVDDETTAIGIANKIVQSLNREHGYEETCWLTHKQCLKIAGALDHMPSTMQRKRFLNSFNKVTRERILHSPVTEKWLQSVGAAKAKKTKG